MVENYGFDSDVAYRSKTPTTLDNDFGDDGLNTPDLVFKEHKGIGDGLFFPTTMTKRYKDRCAVVGIALCIALVCVSIIAVAVVNASVSAPAGAEATPPVPVPVLPVPTGEFLAAAVTLPRLTAHLQAFEAIAGQFGGSRSVENGYNASVAYVLSVLAAQAPSLCVETQAFEVDIFTVAEPATLRMEAPAAVDFKLGVDFLPMTGYVGAVEVQEYVAAPAASVFGCGLAAFAGFTAGRIALVRRGECTFAEKVEAAAAAGAEGVMIFDSAGGPFRARLFDPPVPVFALSHAAGVLFLQAGAGAAARMTENTTSHKAVTLNVLAETAGGDAGSVVTIGTHLDSVPEGPGINDNGSGSAANLEIAIALHALGAAGTAPVNKVRFAWWGAEELGLLGARYYVGALNATQRADIALNLDFDMLASPNFQLGVYDGRGAAAPPDVRNASGRIQDLFTAYFAAHGYADKWTLGAFDGRSDYAPFTAAGIPAGGIFGGAEKLKTEAERLALGGLANAPYDPCYHQACDTADNISPVCFEFMAKAAAQALQDVAMQAHLRAWLGGSLSSIVNH